MNLDPIDLDLLEYVANEEPWHIVAAEFAGEFHDPAELVDRIFRLFRAGLIRIIPEAEAGQASPSSLLSAAKLNSWYADTLAPDPPIWQIVATEAGFVKVKERFEKSPN